MPIVGLGMVRLFCMAPLRMVPLFSASSLGIEKYPPNDRTRSLDKEHLNTALRSWLDGPIAAGVTEVSLPVLLPPAR